MASLNTYGFGVVRLDGAASVERRAQLTEVCELLSAAVGAIVIPHLSNGYRALADAVEQGLVAFAWAPPLLVVDLEARGSATLLAIPSRRGSTASFYTALIVKQGGPKSIGELVGKRAGWVDKESVAGRIVARIHLARSGFDLSSLASETYLHSHDAVVEAVVSGRVDVGATFCTLEPGTRRIVNGAWMSLDGTSAKPVEVLATAGPIPNDAILASTKTPAEVRDRVARWLISGESKRGREVLGRMLRAEGFTRPVSSHYTPLREMLATARRNGMDV